MSAPSILLNMVPGLALNTQYDVRVRPFVGSWGTYGAICQLTTPSTARMINPEIVFENDQQQMNDQIHLIIYPNPNQGEYVFVELDGVTEDSRIMVYDIFGKEILNETVPNTGNYNTTLKFNNKLDAGFYFVTVLSGDQRITKKLVVN